jgi:hypothetical protein
MKVNFKKLSVVIAVLMTLILLLVAIYIGYRVSQDDQAPEPSAAQAGSRPVPPESYAYVGYLIQDLPYSTNNVFCTGALLSPNVVLTAAHCYDQVFGDSYFQLGEFNTEITGQNSRVISVNRYPGYSRFVQGDGTSYIDFAEEDLAILTLENAINLDIYPTIVNAEVQDGYFSVGYGLDERNLGFLRERRGTSLEILRFYDQDQEVFDFESYIITTSGRQETSICGGDSGSPIMIADTNQIVGLVSGRYFTDVTQRDCGDPVTQFYGVNTGAKTDFISQYVDTTGPTPTPQDTCPYEPTDLAIRFRQDGQIYNYSQDQFICGEELTALAYNNETNDLIGTSGNFDEDQTVDFIFNESEDEIYEGPEYTFTAQDETPILIQIRRQNGPGYIEDDNCRVSINFQCRQASNTLPPTFTPAPTNEPTVEITSTPFPTEPPILTNTPTPQPTTPANTPTPQPTEEPTQVPIATPTPIPPTDVASTNTPLPSATPTPIMNTSSPTSALDPTSTQVPVFNPSPTPDVDGLPDTSISEVEVQIIVGTLLFLTGIFILFQIKYKTDDY